MKGVMKSPAIVAHEWVISAPDLRGVTLLAMTIEVIAEAHELAVRSATVEAARLPQGAARGTVLSVIDCQL